jgi:biotin carboxylase
MAEACVRGVEMSVESLVSDGVPVFVNVTEYYEPRWANLLPARLPEAQRAALLDLNLCAIRALGVGRGITHLEVFLTAEGFVFGELAARPPGGHLMELIELAYGFDPWACCLELERGRSVRAAQLAQRAAGVRVLHPGAGRVVAVNGLEAIARLPQLVRLVCRARPGDLVAERAGAGQEVGYAIFQSERREDVAAALEAARREISFAMAGA